jgi:hypothetical protein
MTVRPIPPTSKQTPTPSATASSLLGAPPPPLPCAWPSYCALPEKPWATRPSPANKTSRRGGSDGRATACRLTGRAKARGAEVLRPGVPYVRGWAEARSAAVALADELRALNLESVFGEPCGDEEVTEVRGCGACGEPGVARPWCSRSPDLVVTHHTSGLSMVVSRGSGWREAEYTSRLCMRASVCEAVHRSTASVAVLTLEASGRSVGAYSHWCRRLVLGHRLNDLHVGAAGDGQGGGRVRNT